MNKRPIKKIIKNNLLLLLEWSKCYKLASPFYSGIGHILIFHRVCPKKQGKRIPWCAGLEVTPEYLKKIIVFFTGQNYEFISLDKLFDSLHRDKIDNKFVVITFDDGYVDNLTYAYPVLKKYNIPFTIYITTNFPEGRTALWWYSLEELILENDHIALELEEKSYEFSCSSMKEKEDSFRQIYSIIRDSDENSYLYKIKKIFEPYKIDIYKKTRELMLSWDQIQQLSTDSLVTIGAHAVNHYVLSKLYEPVVREEIISSKRVLESRLNCEIKHFSYPFGGRQEAGIREFEIVKEAGFKTAVTGRAGNIFPAHRNHLESLPRIDIGESLDVQRLKLLISGFTHCITNRFKRVITL